MVFINNQKKLKISKKPENQRASGVVCISDAVFRKKNPKSNISRSNNGDAGVGYESKNVKG
jgi:hypothetical protein